MQRISALCLSVLFTVVFLPTVSVAADEEERLRNLAEELIALRGEVDDLNHRLNSEREQHAQDMRAMSSRKSDLDARIEQEQLTIEKLKKTLAENRELALSAGADASVLKPVLLDVVNDLDQQIRAGLPFKVGERTQVLGEFRQQLEAEVLPPQKAANRLWSFMEDELRLTRENGLYRQTIEVNSKEILVDIARLGMVSMYFKTQDEEYGLFRQVNGEWMPKMLSEAAEVQQVEALFSALQKQIRTGFFVLPNTL